MKKDVQSQLWQTVEILFDHFTDKLTILTNGGQTIFEANIKVKLETTVLTGKELYKAKRLLRKKSW
ncbi:MAG TPA: hypothetical protein DCP31_33320 [Cyanobacteria bacterium UBA8543]|nr:hypothetical protein [Cyanobacteria bacterium UBA8543]